MTRADRELLLSLHAKVDFLIARGGPQVDRFDQALIDALHGAFDTDEFTRRDVIERAGISPALERALLDADVDTSSGVDEAMHWLGYALRRVKGSRVADGLHLQKNDTGRWQFHAHPPDTVAVVRACNKSPDT